jgi:hypothetical protein
VYCLHIVTELATLMLVWLVEFSYWLILVKPLVFCCWSSWPLTLVTQSVERNLTYNMMVTIRNLRGYCTEKQTYENVLNIVVKVTNSL